MRAQNPSSLDHKTKIARLARHLEKSVFQTPQPFSPEEQTRFFQIGMASALAFFLGVLILAAVGYMITDYLIDGALLTFLRDLLYDDEGRNVIRNLRAIPFFVGTLVIGLFAFLSYRWGNEVWKREMTEKNLDLTPDLQLSYLPWHRKFLMFLRFLPELSSRMLIYSYHPELKYEPCPFAIPAAGMMAVLARDHEFFTCDPIGEKLKELGIQADLLTCDETKRLLLKSGLVALKTLRAANGMEVQIFILTESGEILLKRFELGISDPNKT